MWTAGGFFAGSRQGIGLQIVGITFSLLVLLIWFGILPNANGGGAYVGSSGENFRNWMGSSQGREVTAVVLVVVGLILFLSITSAIVKLRGAKRLAPDADDDKIEPVPEPPGNQQK